tara:strand:- start:90994 stop:91149 length:156 start_codon:yes stop_codon:yes gene_type:complete
MRLLFQGLHLCIQQKLTNFAFTIGIEHAKYYRIESDKIEPNISSLKKLLML